MRPEPGREPSVTPAPSTARPRFRLPHLGPPFVAFISLLVLILFNSLFTPNFLSLQTLNVNLTQVATIVIVGVGMTLVIATGGIDLSVGSLMAISGAAAPLIFLNPSLSPALGLALAFSVPVLAAGAGGLFNGLLVTRFRIQPIIATLILYIAGRGVAQVLTNGNLQSFRNPAFEYLAYGRPLGIPFQVLLMLLIVVLAAWLLRATVFGRYLVAVGDNEAAARLAGIPVGRVKTAVYMLSGVLAGVAGLIVVAINRSSDASQVGLNMELDAIAAVAVGGTALTGGRTYVIGTLLGACIIQLIRYTLLAWGVPDAAALIVKAVIIIVAVYFLRPRDA